MQVCADVMSRPIDVVASDQCGTLGAAIFAAVAAGQFANVASAQKIMASRIEHTYTPEPAAVAAFEALYQRDQQWVAQSETMYAANQEEKCC